MGTNYVESSLKRFLKRKVKVTLGLIVAFMITGTIGFAEEKPVEKMDSFEKAEFYLKNATNEEISSLNGKEWSDKGYEIKVSESEDKIEINFNNFTTDGTLKNISLDKSQVSSEVAAKITSTFETIFGKNIDETTKRQRKINNTVVYSGGNPILINNVNNGILIVIAKTSGQTGSVINNGIIFLHDNAYMGQNTSINAIMSNYGIIYGGLYSQSLDKNAKFSRAYNYGILSANNEIQRIVGTESGIYNYGYIFGKGKGQNILDGEANRAYNYGEIIAADGQYIKKGENHTVKNYGYIEVEDRENGQYIMSGTEHKAENYGVINSTGTGYAVNVKTGTGEGINYGTVIKDGKNVFTDNTVTNKGIVILENVESLDNTYKLGNNEGIVLGKKDNAYTLLNTDTVVSISGDISDTFTDSKSTAYVTGTKNEITKNLNDKVLGTVVTENISEKGAVFEFDKAQTEEKETLTLTDTVLTGYFQDNGTLLDMGSNNLTLVGDSKLVTSKDNFDLNNVVALKINGILKMFGNSEVAGKITGSGTLSNVASNDGETSKIINTDMNKVILQNAVTDEEIGYLKGDNYTNVIYESLKTNSVIVDFKKTADGKTNKVDFTDNLLIKGENGIAIDGRTTTEGNNTDFTFSTLDSEKVQGDILLGAGNDNIKIVLNGDYKGLIDLGTGKNSFEVAVKEVSTDHIIQTENTFNYKINGAEKVVLNRYGWHIGKDAEFNNNEGDKEPLNLHIQNGELHIDIFKTENGNVVSSSFDNLVKGADIKITTDGKYTLTDAEGNGTPYDSGIKYVVGEGFELTEKEFNVGVQYDISEVKEENIRAAVIFDVDKIVVGDKDDVKLTVKSADDFGLGDYKEIYSAVLGKLPESEDLRNAVNNQNEEDFKDMITTARDTAEALYTTGYAVTKDVTDTYMSVVEDFGRKAGKGEWIAHGKYVNTDSEFDGDKSSKGYDGDITGTVGMLEYGLTDATSYGAVFGMGDTEVDINGGGKLDGDNYYAGAYVKHRTKNGIDLLGNVGYTKSELDLNLATTVGSSDYHVITDGNSDAEALTFSLKGRKDYRIFDSVILQPVAGLRYSFINQDTVESKDAAFRMDGQDVEVFEGLVGGNIIKEFDISNGKLSLMAGAEFILTEVNENDNVKYTLYGKNIELTEEEEIADNRVEAHVGAEYIHENGVGVDVKYEFVWTDKGDSDRITAGISYRF